ALWAVGVALETRQAMMSYLAAFAYVASIALGVLVLLLIGNVMGARWLVAVRRVEEAVVASLPVLALLFVPIAVGMEHIYSWAGHDPSLTAHDHHLIEHKRPYLDVSFFIVRTAVYFAVWIVVAELLRRWSIGRARRAG